MTSCHRRFLAGEHTQVWAEIGVLGTVPAGIADDVAAVADETVRRVAAHVPRLAAELPSSVTPFGGRSTRAR